MPETAYSRSILDAGVLPPWGILYRDFQQEVKGIRLPADWLVTSNVTLEQRVSHFERWRKETLQLLNEVLWPTYDWDAQVWKGPSTSFMCDLTLADLNLALRIQHPPDGAPRFTRQPESPLATMQVVTHHDLFSQEDLDGGSHMFDALGVYDRSADSDLLQASIRICEHSCDNKETPVSYHFKSDLQRPRPMQMALRFKIFEYQYEDAGTSITPSMCSGHCLQGLLGVGGLIESLLDHRMNPNTERVAALGHWAVDIGDRRIMAGVHYPADSLCSWIIFMRMADSVFHRSEVKEILGNAISNYSYILSQIKQYACTPAGKVYAPALEALDL